MSDEIIEPRKRSIPEHPAHIVDLFAELSEDHRKVRVMVELDRGDTKPDLDLRLLDKKDREICSPDIVELFGETMTFTMHTRQTDPVFPLTLICRMSYIDDAVQEEKQTEIPEE